MMKKALEMHGRALLYEYGEEAVPVFKWGIALLDPSFKKSAVKSGEAVLKRKKPPVTPAVELAREVGFVTNGRLRRTRPPEEGILWLILCSLGEHVLREEEIRASLFPFVLPKELPLPPGVTVLRRLTGEELFFAGGENASSHVAAPARVERVQG